MNPFIEKETQDKIKGLLIEETLLERKIKDINKEISILRSTCTHRNPDGEPHYKSDQDIGSGRTYYTCKYCNETV